MGAPVEPNMFFALTEAVFGVGLATIIKS